MCGICMLGTHGGDVRNSCLGHGMNSGKGQNLRLERSHEAGRGTKTSKSCSLLQVGRSIFGNVPGNARLADYLRWAPQSWPIEAWECRVVSSLCVESKTVVLADGCEVETTMLQTPEWFSKLLGPGEPLRSWLGWTPLLHTASSGVWIFRGGVAGRAASCCTCVSS